MNAAILKVAARGLVTTTLWYALGMVLFGLVMVLVYPTIRDSSIDMTELMESYPSTMLDAFGISPDADFTNYAVFMSAEYLNLIWPIIAAVFVIMAGTAVIASEIESGTAELWLAIPVRRNMLLAPKVVSLLAASLVLVLSTMVVIGAGAAVYDNAGDTTASGVLALGVLLLAFMVCVGGYSILLSSLFRQRGRAAGVAAAITIAAYLGSLVSSLVDSLSWLRFLTFWTAYDPQEALSTGSVPIVETGVLIAIGIVAVAAAFIIFPRRDIVL